MKKFVFVLGLAVGYVLGARAGRKRYEQIASAAQSVWQSKPVQSQVHKLEDVVQDQAAKVSDAALDGVKKLAGQVIDSRKSKPKRESAAPAAN
ncbi:oxygen-dependent protoporphyrinogen oxidase [Pseudoclavibacter chungangensis]|uniref:hypothetical protein n=1 Tax=Pseudoclavibacter chungangensis TaxID=587635 RepID=UPI0017C00EAB|nr:hypothetical protein [Pseudoclavibacter chungangensis]NYJ68213.1 oxygen-dependent protoporphyrinogen oxidase [Pseudoclavibacter chungangensis]